MDIKESATKSRNSLQQGIYRIINPFVRLLIRVGVTPNMVTTVGLLGNIAAAVMIVIAANHMANDPAGETPYWMFTLSGALVIGFSVFDMLDGQVARLGNMVTRFGAMYDSILDRYCELFTLGAIAWYFSCVGSALGVLVTFFALVGSLMVSYVRARGEGMGVVCKIGFMQRPERVVVTTLAVLTTGIVGSSLGPASTFDADIILFIGMCIIAVFANVTAIARIMWCKKEINKQDR